MDFRSKLKKRVGVFPVFGFKEANQSLLASKAAPIFQLTLIQRLISLLLLVVLGYVTFQIAAYINLADLWNNSQEKEASQGSLSP